MNAEQVLDYAPIIQSGLSADGQWVYAVTRRSRADGVRLELSFRDLRGGGWRSPIGEEERVAPSLNRASTRWAALARLPSGYRVVVGALDRLEDAPTMLPRGPHRPRVLKWDCRDRLACLGEDARGDTRVWLWRDLDGDPDWVTAHQHRVVDYALHPTLERLVWLDRAGTTQPFEEGATQLWLGWLEPRQPVALEVPGQLFGYLSWSPDGRWLAWQARSLDAPLAPPELWCMAISDLGTPGEPVCLTEGIDGAIGGYDWAPDGSIVAAVEAGTTGRLYRLRPGVSPASPEPSLPDGFLSGPRFDRADGRLLFLRQSLSEPQRLCLREPDGPVLSAGRFSRALERAPRQSGRTLRWTSGELTIDGVLLTPEGEGPWPLLVWAHGGPAHHISETFSPYFQVLVGAGYAVLAPNYRGSTGRGQAFCEAGVGALCSGDAADLRAGVDAAIAEGVANPEQIGVIGWSYGGALALALARDDARVKAVAAGSAVADWMGLLGATTFPTTAWRYVGSLPWEDRAPWDAASPVSWIGRVDAPTLFLHGTEDAAVPFAQSVLLYRLLSARGVPCELAWYRGEGHTITSPVAVVDMLGQLLAWFARHLGDAPRSALP